MNKFDFEAAMQRFKYDLERRSVTHAILCELPRARNVDDLLRARGDCIILNAEDRNARTLVFVLWREHKGDEPPREDVNVYEPVSPRQPDSIFEQGIAWAATAKEHDELVDSDPDLYQTRLLSSDALGCFL
jgi:hypothetical protein